MLCIFVLLLYMIVSRFILYGMKICNIVIKYAFSTYCLMVPLTSITKNSS